MKILIVGYGAMGSAIGERLKQNFHVTAIDPFNKKALANLNDLEHGYQPDLIIFAVKPQVMAETLPPYKIFPNAIILSIAAGLPITSFKNHLFNKVIIRAMPNTPAQVGEGMTTLFAENIDPKTKNTITEIFDCIGSVVWVDDEDTLHATTAIAGSGPAYVFAFVESLTTAGIKAGLDQTTAYTLAKQTVIGAAQLLKQSDFPAETLRKNVTSPNGTTAAGLEVLRDELDQLITQTVRAALQRSQELAK